ncbi:MAG: rhodanese-like domain-containing protein [Balneolaceae bacterium]|nr:MAG: rhodanese-like domain-containing protein [Balneolaceae bacterium]
MSADITVQELSEKLKNGDEIFILDVREEFEYDISNLSGFIIPLPELENRMYELEDKKDMEVIVHCRTGERSVDAVKILVEYGFKNPKNLLGGINQWAREIDTGMREY